MAVITLTDTMKISTMSWGQQRNDVSSRSVFGAQAMQVADPLWIITLSTGRMNDINAGEWKSTLMKLKGQVNQFELWDKSRPEPVGTMRGTMTLNASASQGATSLSITAGAGQASTTLKQGDLLQIGTGTTQQVIMIVADATANGSGVITVTIEPPLRNAFSGGSAVTWDKPKALFRRTSSDAVWDYSLEFVSGFSMSLIEDWRV